MNTVAVHLAMLAAPTSAPPLCSSVQQGCERCVPTHAPQHIILCCLTCAPHMLGLLLGESIVQYRKTYWLAYALDMPALLEPLPSSTIQGRS
jgi:hypothetical protein